MTVSSMHDRDAWEVSRDVELHLARHLARNRLVLVLGAGVSMGYGLPSWPQLVEKGYAGAGRTADPALELEDSAEKLAGAYGGDRVKLGAALRHALYDGASYQFADLLSSEKPLLVALGAVVMNARIGVSAPVISFNFDDLLEVYLNGYGMDVRAIDVVPEWGGGAHVDVYHPHGLLTSDLKKPVTRGVVFAAQDYDAIVGDAKDTWRQTVTGILRSYCCVFIGLSGKDQNLSSMLLEIGKGHACHQHGDLFWGVRIADNENDPLREKWQNRGVWQLTLASYDDLPPLLFRLCQEATNLRRGVR